MPVRLGADVQAYSASITAARNYDFILQVYKCLKEECSLTFRDLDEFIAHVNSHESDMTYRCHECHKVFKSLHDLGVHQYQVHLNSRKKGAQTK